MSLPLTIGARLAVHAKRDPQGSAIVCPGLRPLCFHDLDRQIGQIARQLRGNGIGAQSRVAIVLERGPEAALLSVAVCSMAILVPINPNLPPADLQAELKRVRPHALIVAADAAAGWRHDVDRGVGLFAAGKAVTSFDDIVLHCVRAPACAAPASPVVTAQSWAAIFRTSGTTGISKRVPVTHENLLEMADRMERWLGLTPRDRSACIMPIYYNAGFKATLLVPLLIGCSVALPASTAPAEFDRWLSELRPTWLTTSPSFLRALVERQRPHTPSAGGAPAHSLRFVLSTASYLPDATRAAAEQALHVPVVEFYGLCEAGMVTAPALPPQVPRPGSVGRIPDGELAIRRDNGTPARPGQSGQVMLRGPGVMPGYLVDDIEGQPCGLEDGWLATGDIGVVDDDGFLSIVGRSKEIINRGGEKISPYDVERALLRHPAVREAAAFSVPHRRLGENVGAAVVLHPGTQAASHELVDFIYDHLAPFQMPRHIHVVDSLPVGATGKIARPQLSARFAAYRPSITPPSASLEIVIADIWQRHLGSADFGIDDDFFEIGGDSLQATEMLLELEEQTRYRIAPSNVRAQLTIRQLCDILAGAAEARHEALTRAKSGEGTPLFLCHGDYGGWGFYAFRLAERLKARGPVYLLHSLIDPGKGVRTIEDMVRHYMPAIDQVAPAGPIRLAGYCHGGLSALEVAHQLEKAGRTVESVVLIDTFSLNARPIMRRLVPLVSAAADWLPGGFGDRMRRRAGPSLWRLAIHILARDRAIGRRLARTMWTGKMGFTEDSRRDVYYRAMSRYVPRPIRAEVLSLVCNEYADKREYAPAAWAHIAPGVRAGRIPGGHTTCISRHVAELADCLNQADPPPPGAPGAALPGLAFNG